MESILQSIKRLLDISADDTSFDTVLIIHINSVLSILEDLGIGKVNNYIITGPENIWSEFISANQEQACKTYMGLKVRMMFDPPQTSFTQSSMNELIKELEWRLTNKKKGGI